MANYKKRKDGRYARQVVIGITPEGKIKRKTLYAKTLRELDKKYREFMDLKDKGVVLQDTKLAFCKVAEMWLINEKKPNLKPQSFHTVQMRVDGINNYIGHIKIEKLNLTHLEQIKTDMVNNKGCVVQYNRYVSLIKSILKYAMSKDIVSRNVAESLKTVKAEKAKKRALTEKEWTAFLTANLTTMERVLVDTMYYTGMRRNEVLALEKEDIDTEKMTVKVHKTLVSDSHGRPLVQQNTKTTAGSRTLPITKALQKTLIPYVEQLESSFLFTNAQGNIFSNTALGRVWKKILEKVKEANNGELADDITPHIFRHTYASNLYKAGIDIKTAQYLLGHTDIKTTLDTYTHFGFQDVPIVKLDEYFSDAVKLQSENKIIPLKAL